MFKSLLIAVFLLAMVYPSWGQSLDLRAGRYLDTEEYFIEGGLLCAIFFWLSSRLAILTSDAGEFVVGVGLRF